MSTYKLRPYQTRVNLAVELFLKDILRRRGMVFAPTGSGKTECFIDTIKTAIAGGARNIAVLHPRIALSQDQLARFQNAFGAAVHFTSFRSGAHRAGNSNIREYADTNPERLKATIDQTSRPHITFSTYKSFHKLVDGELCDPFFFDLVICDEAHNFVEQQYYRWLENIQANKIIFYTATPITDEVYSLAGDGTDNAEQKAEHDRFMKNKDLFGTVIEKIEPKELIVLGYILAPLVHFMEAVTRSSTDKSVDPVALIAKAFVEQYKDMTDFGMPYTQMLVACRGIPDIDEVNENLNKLWEYIREYSEGEIDEIIDVYTVDSTNGELKNGRIIPGGRDKALNDIRYSRKHAIVIHYDTLAEGIDINSITGVLVMRKLSKSKFLQTIGRAGRPFFEDLDSNKNPRKECYDSDVGLDIRKKRRSIITIPIIDGAYIGNLDAEFICNAFIIGGYDDLMTYIHVPEDNPTGSKRKKKRQSSMDYAFLEDAKITRDTLRYQELFEGGL
jgi:superfamily II DNA or RNA helicase